MYTFTLSFNVPIIVVVPLAIPVIRPAVFTVATPASSELHVILSVWFAGATV